MRGCQPREIGRPAMRVATIIESKLHEALAPERLAVIDESHRHAGHAGARPEGETHFRVEVVSAAFRGVSRLDRQRRIYAILDAELKGPVHALAIRALAPEEDKGG
jgi:BolA family transcriptional regulator, general stress-responsive regulator